MIGASFAFVRRARADHFAVVDLHSDFGAMLVFKLAEFSFDSDSASGDVHFNAGGHWDRFFANSGHCYTFTGSNATSGRGFVLPNFAQNFAAQVFLPGFAVADHAAAGADDRNTKAVQNGFERCGRTVHPAARLAHTLDMTD